MIIFHIDANTAYLSWSARALLERGATLDLRTVPSAVGGSQASRRGIVLAKSIPAKKHGVKTGESLFEARQKCPDLLVVSPDYDLYMGCSDAMYSILTEYSPVIQRYSVDECFLDYTASAGCFGDALAAAEDIQRRMRCELGFTVNIGISSNKLLAKMASEMEKPDRIHTLFPEEISEKMWPLPVSELFMVGRATAKKLAAINVRTIGELAAMDRRQLVAMLKSHGELIGQYARGIDSTPVIPNDRILQKGIGNSMTIFYDVTDRCELHAYLLSLCERASARLRRQRVRASLISVSFRTDVFASRQHQRQFSFYTDRTSEIYRIARVLVDECWMGEPVRQLGVSLGAFSRTDQEQLSVFDRTDQERQPVFGRTDQERLSVFGRGEELESRSVDACVDDIRARYGTDAIMRGVFANTTIKPMEGGVNEGQFLMMGGYGL
jgi:DNA polymerase-4